MSARSFSSSFLLQLFLYFDTWYSVLYFFIGIINFIYKPVALPYPRYLLGWEAAGFTFLFILTVVRLFLGYQGNLAQKRFSLAVSLFLSLASIVGHVYYYTLQTYVLRIDQVLNVIALIFDCGEILFSVFTLMQITQKINRKR